MILVYEYLTIWFWLMYVLDVWYNVPILNTYVLSSIVALFGLYITYYIKEFHVLGRTKVTGRPLIVGDFVLHQLPFIYMLAKHCHFQKRYSLRQTVATVAIACAYYACMDLTRIYRFDRNQTKYVLLITCLLWVVFYTVLLC